MKKHIICKSKNVDINNEIRYNVVLQRLTLRFW